jgi:hypothetical protein
MQQTDHSVTLGRGQPSGVGIALQSCNHLARTERTGVSPERGTRLAIQHARELSGQMTSTSVDQILNWHAAQPAPNAR